MISRALASLALVLLCLKGMLLTSQASSAILSTRLIAAPVMLENALLSLRRIAPPLTSKSASLPTSSRAPRHMHSRNGEQHCHQVPGENC